MTGPASIPGRTLLAAWPYWQTAELFRIQDNCLIAIEDRKPLAADWLDALPPWRAVMMLRLAAGTLGHPVVQETVDEAKAKAIEHRGSAGPGWLTGRRGRTCADCGRTVWPDDGHSDYLHTGACRAPRKPGGRHPVNGEWYVEHDYGTYGVVLMRQSHARLVEVSANAPA